MLGVRMIELHTQHMHVTVDLDRGAELTHVGPDEHRNVLAFYDWESPLPAARSTSYGDDRQDWLSSYRGGWQELFPNAGLGCQVDGVPLPFHGEVSLARWDLVHQTVDQATVRCASRLPLVVERRMTLRGDRPTMQIQEAVTNVSGAPVSFLWGHHPAFESPPGSLLDLPDGITYEVGAVGGADRTQLEPGSRGDWPDVPVRSGPPADLSVVPSGPVDRVCYLREVADWYAFRPPDGPGIALAWDLETFPTLWLWQNIGGTGYPMYGRARITALEPNSASPGDGLARAIERGDALSVAPHGTRETWLTATVLVPGSPPVKGVDRVGQVSTAQRQPG